MKPETKTAPAGQTAEAGRTDGMSVETIRIVLRGRGSRKRLVASIPACVAERLVSQLNSVWGAALWAGIERTCPLAGAFIDGLWDVAYENTGRGEVRVVEVG